MNILTKRNTITQLAIALHWTGRQENLAHFPPLPPSFNALNSSLCSTFLIYPAKSISSKDFCLGSCWLHRSVFGPHEGLALGALPGGTQLLEDKQDEAHPQQKQIFFFTIISLSNSLLLLHEIRSCLKCCCILMHFSIHGESGALCPAPMQMNTVPGAKPKVIPDYITKAAVSSVKWQTKLSHSAGVWVVESLIFSALTIKTSLFQIDLFFLAKHFLLIGGRGVVWG